MRSLLLAFQFLTIVPIRISGDLTEGDMARSATFFPLVGVAQGCAAALAGAAALHVFSPGIAGACVIIVLTLSNGGFHLDGIADTFDALAVKSSGDTERDRARRLDVMKDSSTGAIGVVAVVLTVLTKFLFLQGLFTEQPVAVSGAIVVLMAALSKWSMIPAMYHGVPARPDGLGRIFIGHVSFPSLLAASFIVLLLFAASRGLIPGERYGMGTVMAFPLMAGILYGFSYLWVRFCERRFGGLTGDTFGAMGELSEILFLAVASAWLRHSF